MTPPARLPSSPRRILIIKPSSLGDVVHTLPVLHLLRRQYPHAHISWLVAPYCAGLLQNHPDLNEVILFDRRRFGTAWYNPKALGSLIHFHRDLHAHRFDLVIDVQGLFRSGWLSWQTGSPIRVGFANARELAWTFYTHRVPVENPEIHAADRYMKLAAAVGCEIHPAEFHFPVSDADRAYVRESVGARPYAVLLPGANWPTKRWPAERFAELVGPLSDRFGLQCVIAGGGDAAEVAPRISSALNLTNRTTVPQLVALIELASLVVANDSGPMHIAAALNKPLVAVFGPTNPVRTGPYGRPECVVHAFDDCIPCYKRACGHSRCLRNLHIEPVLRAIHRQLSPGWAALPG